MLCLFKGTAPTKLYTLSLHDALPIFCGATFEVSSAIRLPVACMYEGTSRATAVAVVTATGGASGCVPAPRPLPPFVASPPPAASAFDSERPHDAVKSVDASKDAASAMRPARASLEIDIGRPTIASHS